LARKQKKVELKPAPTKRQLAKWQRQQRTQRIIMIVGGLFLASIIGYIGYGYYSDQVKPLSQPVVRVNDAVFDMDYYIKILDIYSQGQESAVVSAMADMVIEAIEQNELVRQRAAGLGTGVSDEEINSELGNLDLPNNEVYRDVVGAKVLTDRLLEDYFDPKVPTTGEQVQVQAMFLESNEVVEEVIDKLGAGDNFTSLAKEFSTEAVTKEKGGDLGWLPKDFADILLGDSMLKDIVFNLELGMLSEPTYDESIIKEIGYWLIEVVERDEDKGSYTRGILLGSRQEAEQVKAMSEAGEDFAVLVQEYSQDSESKDQGGDLGWTQEGFVNEVVSEVAFELELNVLSEPIRDETVQTRGGYWLVKVADEDANRQLEDEVREGVRLKLFGDWIEEQRSKSLIENYLTQEQKSWAVGRVLRGRG